MSSSIAHSETLGPPTNQLLQSWTYSLSFPLGVAILVFMRLRFGYYLPLPPDFGLAIIAVGVVTLLLHFLIPVAANPALKTAGGLFGRTDDIPGRVVWFSALGTFGRLVLLIAFASALWPLSRLQLLRLKNGQ